MQLFEEISTLLSGQKPFVCYVKPNECIWNLQVQQTNEIVAFSGQSGFVFMPFDAGVKICLPTEISAFSQGNFENLEQKSAYKFTSEANQKEAFEHDSASNKAYLGAIRSSNVKPSPKDREQV